MLQKSPSEAGRGIEVDEKGVKGDAERDR